MVGYRTTKESWITRLLAEGLEPRVILLETGIPTRQAAAREYGWIELGFCPRSLAYERCSTAPLSSASSTEPGLAGPMGEGHILNEALLD